jgi:hypothetical protein
VRARNEIRETLFPTDVLRIRCVNAADALPGIYI